MTRPVNMLRYVLLLFVWHSACQAMHWNYHNRGPDTWSDHYPSCSGQYQSPINILTACTVYQSFSPFEFTASYGEPEKVTLKNIGTAIVGVIEDADRLSSIYLKGGGLNGTYEFVNFHLHWGKNYRSGSEHHVNGKKYAGEVHFVHRNRETGQLAVLGMFLDSYTKEHPIHQHQREQTQKQWEKYMDVTEQLSGESSSIVFDLILSALMGDNLQEFWRYEGSLTTPPCTEGVIWTVFREPIVVTEEHMEKLREKILLEGHRPPQPLYNRVVYRNYLNESASTIPDYNRCAIESPLSSSLNFSSFLVISSLLLITVVSAKFVFSNEKNKLH